jgi:hypothetical protein
MIAPGQALELGHRFETRSYVDSNGDPSLLLACRIEEDGSFLEIFPPNALSSASCRKRGHASSPACCI